MSETNQRDEDSFDELDDESSDDTSANEALGEKKSALPNDLTANKVVLNEQSIKALQGVAETARKVVDASFTFGDTVQKVSLALPKISDGLTVVLTRFAKYSSIFYRSEAFESFKRTTRSIIEALPDYMETMEKLCRSMQGALESFEYLNLLIRSEWPLYLVANEAMSLEIRELGEAERGSVADAVAEIACRHLGDSWIELVREQWCEPGDLTSGEAQVLSTALDHHLKGEYFASTALLMCMSEGLVEKYCGEVEKLEGEDLELFNKEAPGYGLKELGESGRRNRNGIFIKDKMVVLVMQVETGALIWKAASSYVINTVFANGEVGGADDRHPRRNKICHGGQTEYGTIEHSLKAILTVDVIIRLGRVIAAYREGEYGKEC